MSAALNLAIAELHLSSGGVLGESLPKSLLAPLLQPLSHTTTTLLSTKTNPLSTMTPHPSQSQQQEEQEELEELEELDELEELEELEEPDELEELEELEDLDDPDELEEL